MTRNSIKGVTVETSIICGSPELAVHVFYFSGRSMVFRFSDFAYNDSYLPMAAVLSTVPKSVSQFISSAFKHDDFVINSSESHSWCSFCFFFVER